MERKFYFYLVSALLLFGSCSQDSDDPSVVEQPTNDIQFSTSVVSDGADTRAVITETEFPKGGSYDIGIYMMDPGSTSNVYNPAWTGITNTSQYKNAGATLAVSSGGVHTWSNFTTSDGSTLSPASRMVFELAGDPTAIKADFYAYYPHNKLSTPPELNAVPFDLTNTNKDDILFSYKKGYTKQEMLDGTRVGLKFFHAMSLIALEVKNTGKVAISVSAARLTNQGSNTHVRTTGTFNLAGAEIAADELSATCAVTATAPAAGTKLENTLTSAISLNPDGVASSRLIYLLIPPTTTPESDTTDKGVTLTLTVDGYQTTSCLLPLPLIDEGPNAGKYGFEQGKMHTYEISIDASIITFQGLSIGAWGSGAGSTIII